MEPNLIQKNPQQPITGEEGLPSLENESVFLMLCQKAKIQKI
jgi:hypothetical protein